MNFFPRALTILQFLWVSPQKIVMKVFSAIISLRVYPSLRKATTGQVCKESFDTILMKKCQKRHSTSHYSLMKPINQFYIEN